MRPPTSYPLTIKSPGSGTPVLGAGMAGNTTSIRLTSASQPSSVQLVPMSIPANIRPQVWIFLKHKQFFFNVEVEQKLYHFYQKCRSKKLIFLHFLQCLYLER